MTIEVRKNATVPVTPPPVTYDITGLSYDQASVIRDLLGVITSRGEANTYEVYVALHNALPGVSQYYQFTTNSPRNEDKHLAVNVLYVHPLG